MQNALEIYRIDLPGCCMLIVPMNAKIVPPKVDDYPYTMDAVRRLEQHINIKNGSRPVN